MRSLTDALPWSLLGLILLVPYAELAEIPEEYLKLFLIICPVLAVLGAMLWNWGKEQQHRGFARGLHLIFLAWAFSPLIMNGGTKLLEGVSPSFSSFLFENRFVPLWLPPAVILVIALVVGDLLRTYEQMQKFQERSGEEPTKKKPEQISQP